MVVLFLQMDKSQLFNVFQVFYFTGSCGLFWSVFWFFLVYDSPDQHPRISVEEREYITREIHKYQLEKTIENKQVKIGLRLEPKMSKIDNYLCQYDRKKMLILIFDINLYPI